MSLFMISLIFVNLAIFLCIKNFVVQILAMKFSVDALFLFLGSFSKNSELLQSVGWILLSLVMLLIFLILISGLRKTAQIKKAKQAEIF